MCVCDSGRRDQKQRVRSPSRSHYHFPIVQACAYRRLPVDRAISARPHLHPGADISMRVMRDYGNEFHHRRKNISRAEPRANRAIKINTRPDRIDPLCLLMIYIGHRRRARSFVRPFVRYARVHVNGRRGYHARGSKLKLKRIHRESFRARSLSRSHTNRCIFTVLCVGTCPPCRTSDHRYLAAADGPRSSLADSRRVSRRVFTGF